MFKEKKLSFELTFGNKKQFLKHFLKIKNFNIINVLRLKKEVIEVVK